MYFYGFILVMLFIYISEANGIKSIVADSGIGTVSPCSVGIVFFVKLNNTSNNDCDVEVTPDVCCLSDEDCNVLKIMGGYTCFVPAGMAKILKLVAPILDPYERQGYCTIYVDSKSNNRINKRETIKINFDTSVKKYKEESKIKHCKNKDEDPLNYCQPVNCDKFYNGKRPFYNTRFKKCVNVPPCLVTDDTYSNVVYNPVSNRCIKRSIGKKDIKALKRLTHFGVNGRKPKDLILITNSTAFDNDTIDMIEVDDLQTNGKKFKVKNHKKNQNYTNFLFQNPIMIKFNNFQWIVLLLGLIILIQCAIICTMWCLRRSCPCANEKPLVRKYFNNDPVDSLTTPLISTSIMDTGTLGNQCLSESSSNNKLKCYKACENDRDENIKLSMSDDILSKCLNRRDWKNYHNPEVKENETNKDMNNISQFNLNHKINSTNKDSPTFDDPTITYKDEKSSNKKPKTTFLNTEITETSTVDTNKSSKEKIKSQSHSCYHTKVEPGITPEKKSDSMTNKSKVTSDSTEKAAQTYFSKDSIDAILSERGYIYLAGGDLSKYTFSGDTGNTKSTEMPNKGSKTFFKYFHSFLHRNSKQGSQSDPGKEKDLQLLHMSKASLYSSSNDSN